MVVNLQRDNGRRTLKILETNSTSEAHSCQTTGSGSGSIHSINLC